MSEDLNPPVTEEKPKRTRKKRAEGEVSSRQRLSKLYPEDAVITVLVDGNPKKAGSRAAQAFDFYRESTTVGDFFAKSAHLVSKTGKKAGGSHADIKYDVGAGYIRVG